MFGDHRYLHVLTPSVPTRRSSDLIRNGRSIGPAAEKLIALNTVLVWPVFLALAFLAVPFITLMFGENWRPAGEIFPWLLLSQGLMSAMPQPEQVLLPHVKVWTLFPLGRTSRWVRVCQYGCIYGFVV